MSSRLTDRQPGGSGAGRRRGVALFLVSLAVVSAFKLWLVFPDEIVARANPYDQQRFAEMAEAIVEGRWLGPWNVRALAREPGFPLWIALVEPSGIPLRLATELLLLLAAPLFCLALARLGVGYGLLALVHAVLVLQPHGLVAFRDLLPAGFYGAMLLFALAGLLLAAVATSARARILHGVWAGLCLGALAATRPERPLLLVAPLAIVLWEGARLGFGGAGPRRVLGRVAALALPPAIAGAVLVLPISAWNDRHYGVFAETGVTSPHYLAANRVLTSIEQSAPRRFVPVPRDARARGYAVSPAFRALRPLLEGPSWARGVSCRIDRICDDVAAGYFRWLFRESVAKVSGARTHAELEAYFGRVAAEIGEACGDGRLTCRAGPIPFLQPDTGVWLPYLPRSLRRLARLAASPGDWSLWEPDADHPGTPQDVRRLFDRVANRRSALTTNGRLAIAGWLSTEEPVAELRLLVRRTSAAWAPAEPVSPVELVRERAGDGAERVRFRFELEKTARLSRFMAPTLEIQRASGDSVKRLVSGKGPIEADGVRGSVDAFEETGADRIVRRRARSALWLGHSLLLTGATLLGLIALPVLLVRRGVFFDPVVGAALVLLAVALSRVLVLAAIDASSFPARSSRYLYPVVSLYATGMLLLARRAFARRRPRPEDRLEAAADGS